MRKKMTFKVTRTFVTFPIIDFQYIKQQMLNWASRFDICCFLDSHNYSLPSHTLDCILGAGARHIFQADAGNALDELQHFIQKHNGEQKDWIFGHLGYGMKNETEPLHGAGPNTNKVDSDPIGFPDCCFFVPEILIELTSESIRIGLFSGSHREILDQILQSSGSQEFQNSEIQNLRTQASAVTATSTVASHTWTLQPRFTRDEYIQTVKSLRDHILRGDCYEINFCQEFFAYPAVIDPLPTWWRLSQQSPNPFAAFYRLKDSYLLCASPERYLKRLGDKIISQPIKGTSPRVPDSPAEDETSREELYHSPKDRAENVMVVDLVRNDFSKICREGSVMVEELYGIYSFPHVHQMISTVRGELLPGTGLVDCIRATFPMGSMTGAPKNRVVGLIELYERTNRGIFSGAVGYLNPDGDFDFNVVIRSILYNSRNRYLSYLVGSGITWYSDPVAEYEECLWKAEGMKKALGIDS
jgi:para-aminobenzoate synthetase component I